MISVANDCLIPDELAEINAGLADARAKDAAKRQERQSHNLALALRAAAAGIPVFPCSDYDKAPRKGHSFKTASRDAALIEAWWAEHPGSVAGYLPGSVGLLALDGDRHVDATGKIANDGVANVCRLFEAHGASDLLEHVPAVLTPNKGVHFLLQRPPGGPPISNRRGKLPKGIDVRCDGGYLILEGSIISDGRQYTAANKGLLWALENRAFPPAPAFVLAAIAAPEVNSPPVDLTGDVTADHAAFFQAKVKSVSELFGRTPHGERNNMLTRYTAMLAQLAGMGWGPAGIDRAAFEAFVSGEGDLPEAAKADLRSRLAHGGAPAKRGDDLPAFIASAQLPAEARRRAHLMHALRDLPLDELERLVGAARKAA